MSSLKPIQNGVVDAPRIRRTAEHPRLPGIAWECQCLPVGNEEAMRFGLPSPVSAHCTLSSYAKFDRRIFSIRTCRRITKNNTV